MAKTTRNAGGKPGDTPIKRGRRRLYEEEVVYETPVAPKKKTTKKPPVEKAAAGSTVKKGKEKPAKKEVVKVDATLLTDQDPGPKKNTQERPAEKINRVQLLEVPIGQSQKEFLALQLINDNALLSAGIGLIPVPLFDFAALVALQMNMLSEISEIYAVPFEENKARSLVLSLIAGAHTLIIPRLALQNILKFVPLIGSLMSLAVMPAIAAAITKAVGKIFVYHFETGGKLFDFNPQQVKKHFREQYKLAMGNG